MKTIITTIDAVSEWIGKTIAWLCLAMILGLVFEVASRYLFNQPTEWAHESTTMLYGTFCMIGAVWTLKDYGHVRTEVIHQLLPQTIKITFDLICDVIVLVMLAVFFYAAYAFAMESWQAKEISAKSTWGVPVYPFKTVIPIAVGLMFIQQISHTLKDLLRLTQKNQPEMVVE